MISGVDKVSKFKKKNKHEDNHECFNKDEYKERLILPDSEINLKALEIKTMWFWYYNRLTYGNN